MRMRRLNTLLFPNLQISMMWNHCRLSPDFYDVNQILNLDPDCLIKIQTNLIRYGNARGFYNIRVKEDQVVRI